MAIRLSQVLPPEIVFIAVNNGEVINSGRTESSTAPLPHIGHEFEDNFYSDFKCKSIYHAGNVMYYWYDLNAEMEIESNDTRSWREILEVIVNDIEIDGDIEAFKKSINGIVSNAHSMAKRNNPRYTIESVALALKNKLTRDDLTDFTGHVDFELFLKKRAHDFFHGIKKK